MRFSPCHSEGEDDWELIWVWYCVGMRKDVPEGTDLSYAANAYAATRSAGFGDEAKRRVLLGTYALSAECVFLLLPSIRI